MDVSVVLASLLTHPWQKCQKPQHHHTAILGGEPGDQEQFRSARRTVGSGAPFECQACHTPQNPTPYYGASSQRVAGVDHRQDEVDPVSPASDQSLQLHRAKKTNLLQVTITKY
jgi:hypothetical protein